MVEQAEKIEKAFRNFFPDGTTEKFGDGWKVMPYLATDVFAFAAHLIERGGIYHRVIVKKSGCALSPPWDNGRHLILAGDEIADWCKLGRAWGGRQEIGSPDDDTGPIRTAYEKISKDYWQPLIECAANFSWKDFTSWGKHVFALLVIADEASRDLGYQLDDETLAHPIEQLIRDAWFQGGPTTPIVRGTK